jgi:[ribosomal protein S5]-alanine N-acetyltransferase
MNPFIKSVKVRERAVSVPITTSFGEIRPWNDGDIEALVKYGSNRKIWLNMRDGFPHPYTVEKAKKFIESVGNQNPTTIFAIATAEEAIGSIGIFPNQDVHHLTAEMGYWLAEPYWGKGIMTETVLKLTEYAFEQFGLVRIYAEPYAHNTGSCRVLEKAGFELEGRLRSSVIKDGQIMDQFLYAKVKDG